MEWSVPASNIKDKTEYSYRGLMIDVARNFFSVDEIKQYPDLTKIGGSTEVGWGKGGYYTQEQFKEIVKYARDNSLIWYAWS